MTTTPQQQQGAAEALAGQTTYREHVHRVLMLPLPAEDHRLSGIGQAFWPTRREVAPKNEIEPPIVNCQRCGYPIAPTAGWWCRECFKIVPLLQCYRGMSMVMIARSGEHDPAWSEWVQDFAPWLLAKRLELIRSAPTDWHTLDSQRTKNSARPRTNTKRMRAGRASNGCRRMMPRMEQIWEEVVGEQPSQVQTVEQVEPAALATESVPPVYRCGDGLEGRS